jgi:hypothetical protein
MGLLLYKPTKRKRVTAYGIQRKQPQLTLRKARRPVAVSLGPWSGLWGAALVRRSVYFGKVAMIHNVTLKLAEPVVIGKRDHKIIVKTNGRMLGTLLFSKGNIEWKPNRNSVNKFRFTWEEFAEICEQHGRPARTK